MKFKYKNMLIIIIAGLISIIMFSSAYYFTQKNKEIGMTIKNLSYFTEDKSYHLLLDLQSKLKIVQSVSVSTLIVDEIEKSNSIYENMSEEDRTVKIKLLESQWQSKNELNSLQLDVLSNKVSAYLKSLKNILSGDVGEIFVTNKYGTLVGATDKLSTFSHSNKYWWQDTFKTGSEQNNIDDRGFDDSVGETVIGIVVPVFSNDDIIGILKFNFYIDTTLSKLVDITEIDGQDIYVVRSNGHVLKEKNVLPLSTSLSDSLFQILSENKEGIDFFDNNLRQFVSIKPVRLENFTILKGSYSSIDNSLGNTGEDWFIISVKDYSIFWRNFLKEINLIGLIGLAIIMVIVVVSYFLVSITVKPLEQIILFFKGVKNGDLQKRLEIVHVDEIGQLSKSINEMLDALSNSFASKETLKREIALKVKSEENYSNLFESMEEGFATHEIIVDEAGIPKDYKFLTLNPAFEKMTGIKSEDAVGKTVLELMPRIEYSWIELYGKVALTGKPCNFEKYSKEMDKYFNVSAFCPEPGEFGVIVTDITSLKKAEKKLANEKENLDITLKCIGDGVIATDIERKVVFLNPVAEKLTGWSNIEAKGKIFEDVFFIIDENTRERRKSPIDKVIKSNAAIELENHTSLISKNGVEYIIEDSAAPIRDRTGKMNGVIIVFRDATEKSKIRAKISQTQKIEALGVLAGGIAHDFNNYLAGVFGYIELAKCSFENEELTAGLTFIDKTMGVFENVKALTQQLLTFSKGGKPCKKITDIKSLLLNSVNFSLSGSNIKPILDIDKSLWNSYCDEYQISQCINNLLINSMQAMPDGGELKVKSFNVKEAPVGLNPAEKYIGIEITDTGVGIPKESISNIFDPFYSTKETGHGLGLATVFSIIEHHDGTIEVESIYNEYTKFRIYLPAIESELELITEYKNSDHMGKGGILVLDDQEYILEISKEMLERVGYKAITVNNSSEALDIIEEDLTRGPIIKACILDLTIPGGLGGVDVARRIRNMKPEMKIFASSGYSDSSAVSDPLRNGFDDSLPKPYTMKMLLELFEKHF